MTSPTAADGSDVTAHRAGPPWPVRATSKSAGSAPSVILSISIMMAPVSVRPATDPAHVMAHARAAKARIRLIDLKLSGLIASTGDLLGRRRAWTVRPSDGESAFPRTRLRRPEHQRAGRWWCTHSRACGIGARGGSDALKRITLGRASLRVSHA